MTIKKKKKKIHKKRTVSGWIVFLLLITAVAVLLSQLYLRHISWNEYFASQYEVMGADVSYYQGEIDWEVLSSQIDFAFIKATEGSCHVDIRFGENRDKAAAAGLPIGAYHFFSFESSGKAQAENYIHTVGKWDGMLLPVVDVEYYKTTEEVKGPEEIRKELHDMLEALEAYYGCKPILYATQRSYFTLLFGDFKEYPLWIRNVYFKPLLLQRRWTFWQYEDSARLEGYSGEEDKIDLDVYAKGAEEFESLRLYGN